MLYIGVDLGGTGIKAGVVNERGEILSKGSTPTMKERPYQAIIRDIAALCEDVAKQAARHRRVAGDSGGHRRGRAGHMRPQDGNHPVLHQPWLARGSVCGGDGQISAEPGRRR